MNNLIQLTTHIRVNLNVYRFEPRVNRLRFVMSDLMIGGPSNKTFRSRPPHKRSNTDGLPTGFNSAKPRQAGG